MRLIEYFFDMRKRRYEKPAKTYRKIDFFFGPDTDRKMVSKSTL